MLNASYILEQGDIFGVNIQYEYGKKGIRMN